MLTLRKILILTTLIVASLSGQSQILKTDLINKTVIQYQKAEWDIALKASWSNPYAFNEIALDMILKSPSGKQLTLPCYYESGKSEAASQWKARFAARETGVYSYHFELRKQGQLVSASPKSTFKTNPSKSKGFLKPNDLWTLKYDNGEPFRGVGENICWESRDEDDSKYFEALHENKRFNYDYMLPKLAANGGNFFRTWMIYWNLPVDWKTVQNNSRYQNSTSPYNESGMKRMDHLVELCDSLGIHMMQALESHVGYMGVGWQISNYNVVNGGPAKTPLEFFTLYEARQQYKNKLRLMIARYGYSPSIGAWEFFNEIDNAMYNGKPEDQIPASVITPWHDEMSTFLKNTDPFKHIVTTSVSHRDVAGMNELKNMDMNQRQNYKNTAGIPATLREYSAKYNKPYVIGESGYEWDWSKNFNVFAGEMDGDFKRALWFGMFSPTPILPMSWWWEFFENRGMMSYYKQVSEMNRNMLKAGKGKFESIEAKASEKGLTVYSVRSGIKTFVYVYNSGDKTESIKLNLSVLPKSNTKMQYFDCETGKYNPAKYTALPDKKLQIENLKLHPKGDIILIW